MIARTDETGNHLMNLTDLETILLLRTLRVAQDVGIDVPFEVEEIIEELEDLEL